jgi:hypothetical protein
MTDSTRNPQPPDLDAVGGPQLRELAHRMLDDMLDYTLQIRQRPVWTKMQAPDREALHCALPVAGTDLAEVYQQFQQRILPFTLANVHPGFMGWVQGGGTIVGMLAEMLCAGMNANWS